MKNNLTEGLNKALFYIVRKNLELKKKKWI